MKYYISNVLRIREDTHISAHKGTMVHLFFEVLAQAKKSYDEGKDKFHVKAYKELEVKPPYDYDINELFEDIYSKFVADNKLEWTDEDKQECFTHIESVLGTDEDVRKLKIISTEHKFSLDLPYEWAYIMGEGGEVEFLKINGVIDLVVELDDKTIKFIDWKSGKRKDWNKNKVKEYGDLANDIQLHIYDMVLRKLYPQYENYHVCIVYTADGGPFDFVFSPKSAEKTLERIKERFEAIRDTLVPRLNRTWKCKKFCTFGQKSLPDAPLEYRKYQLNEIGQPMCMCSHIHQEIKANGIMATTEKFRKKKNDSNDNSGTGEQPGTEKDRPKKDINADWGDPL